VLALHGVFGDYRAAASQTLAIGNMVDDVAVLRLLDARYRIAGNDAISAEFGETAAAVEQSYAAAELAFAGNAAALETTAGVKSEGAAFIAAFARETELHATRESLLAQMQTHANAAHDAVNEVLASSANAGHTASVVEADKASDAILQRRLRKTAS